MTLSGAEYKTALNDKLTDLIGALEAHPLFDAGPQDKSVFFIHDFVTRTRTMLAACDPAKLNSRNSRISEEAEDIFSRCMLTHLLVTDTTGKSNMMMGRDPDSPLDFGDDIKDKATACKDLE